MSSRRLNVVVLGCGKTGAIVAEVVSKHGHNVRTVDVDENAHAGWLTAENLRDCDVVIDFTTPEAVLENIAACVRAHKPMVVGTTGWYGEMERVREMVQQAGSGFLWGANFSYGVNLFFQILRAAAPALQHGYSGHITERHHIHKKDAPSGTAIALQRVLEQAAGMRIEISSEREGDVMGVHTLELVSAGDRLVLSHDVLSRQTFAEGAVLGAEWIAGKTGFYDFKDIFSQI